MTSPPLGPGGEDITWPDQVAPRGEERLVPETSNLKPQTSDQCARWRGCVACASSLAGWLLFTSVHDRHVVLRMRCPGPLGFCSPVCTLGVFCCVCGVLGHLAPVLRCARSVRCVACAVSCWDTAETEAAGYIQE